MIIKGANAIKWKVSSNIQGEKWAYFTSTLSEAIAIGIKMTYEYINDHTPGIESFNINEILEMFFNGNFNLEDDAICGKDLISNGYVVITDIDYSYM